ncbi:MAG: hypothetical protein V2I36_08920 [Desulfopila sp.]|jgi:hypothetical protein|nr:hypothetical protein [Desulfopila sp.]
MALINIGSILQASLRAFAKTPPGGGVVLSSYKRNRKIALLKKEADRCILREDGYITEEMELQTTSLEKELRSRIKREFPRSRKVRLYRFTDETELDLTYQKI